MKFNKNKHTASLSLIVFHPDPQGTSISCQSRIKYTPNERLHTQINFHKKKITSLQTKNWLFFNITEANTKPEVITGRWLYLKLKKNIWIRNNRADPLTLLNLIRHRYHLLTMSLNHICGLSVFVRMCTHECMWQWMLCLWTCMCSLCVSFACLWVCMCVW